MADISKITLPSGSTYDIKDATARTDIATLKTQISGGMHYIGTTTTALSDGATTNPITIDSKSVTATSGDLAIYGTMEFVFSSTDNKWHEFGSTGSLKALAFKDNASGNFTPAGSVSKPTFAGTEGSVSVKGTPAGTIGVGTGTANYTPAGSVTGGFSGQSTTSTGKFTPAGTIGVGTGTANYTPAGTISKGTGTANYTPEGSLSGGAISVSLTTATKYVAGSATGGGSKTDGTAAECELPVLTTSVANETLSIGWTAGSFTANVPTAVTMPTFSSATVASAVKSATISTLPTFTGTGAELKFSGTGANLAFTGTQGDVSVSGTPKGSLTNLAFAGTGAELTFTGSETTSTGKFTPAGTVTKPTFTGTEGTVTVS